MIPEDDNTLEIGAESAPDPDLVIITGMSGAGRSQAIHVFEDLGYFCIDNLPPSFIPRLVELASLPGSRLEHLALVIDVRAFEFFDELLGVLRTLDDAGVGYRVLFLEADDETLVRRFKETRRRHPLVDDGGTLLDGISAERRELREVRARADEVVDTSDLKPGQLRDEILEIFFGDELPQMMSISVSSFGFKHGTPRDADIIMDVRFLPNPFYVPELRNLSGLDTAVRDFVLARRETAAFLTRWFDLLESVVPGYIAEGKNHLSVALGCTGGQHRSVALAEQTGAFLRECGYHVAVQHRDVRLTDSEAT